MAFAATKTLGLSVSLLFCAALAGALPATPEIQTTNVLPARVLHGYLMIIGVTIDGSGPFDFLVDTGTNTTLIDPVLARDLSLQSRDRLQLASLASSAAVPRYFLKKFTAGPASISNLEALAIPLTQLTVLDRRIRGVLGMNFLLHFSFRLDFDRPSLELYPSPENAPVPMGLRVPLTINESRLLVSVASTAAPNGIWKLALDSGISQPLVFEHRLSQLVASRGAEKTSRMMQVSTNLAEHSAYLLEVADFAIASARLPQIEVVVLRNDQPKVSDPQDGLLPAAMFHSVFFDRITATLVLTPSPESESLTALQPPQP